MLYRGIDVSHETIRNWCYTFASYFEDIIKKKKFQIRDTWHLDEMTIKINGEYFILWRAVDADGHELDVYLQKRRNKKSAIRFLSKSLNNYPTPRVIITDKLMSYRKPIKQMCSATEHRFHKGLNNRVENAHQPTRRKEKCLIKFKSPQGVQKLVSLMGKVRNLFATNIGRYTKSAQDQRYAFKEAKSIWDGAAQRLLAV